jgi:hypothetical protein
MKHLPLIFLLALVACGKEIKVKKDQMLVETPVVGIPVEFTELPLPDEAGPEIQPLPPIGGPEYVNLPAPIDEEDPEMPGDEPVDGPMPISPEAQRLRCDFSTDAETVQLIITLTDDEDKKLAVVTDVNGDKASLGGFILSPSGNENAAVRSIDKNLTVDGQRVNKITARILLDQDKGIGELELTFRLQGKGKGESQETVNQTLAIISSCVEI